MGLIGFEVRVGKALIFLILFFGANASYPHSVPDSARGRYGTFLASTIPDSGFPWNEITLFPGDLFTLRNVNFGCEDTFGHGTYSHSGDTLVLRDIITWSTFNCTTELLENIVIPEKRYLYRNHGKNNFEVKMLLTGKSAKPKSVLFRKVSHSKPATAVP